MTGIYNITCYNNDSCGAHQFQINVNDVPLNLTGSVIKMQVRKTRDTTPVLSLTSTSSTTGLTIISSTAGTFRIDDQIISTTPDTYLYDIEFTLSTGQVKTYISGSFNVIGDITHA